MEMHCTVTALLLCISNLNLSLRDCYASAFCGTAGNRRKNFCFVIHVQCPGLLLGPLSCFILPHQKRIVTPQDGWFQSIIIRQSCPSGRGRRQELTWRLTKVAARKLLQLLFRLQSEAEQRDQSTAAIMALNTPPLK